MPTRRDDAPGSGCRSDCLHRAMVLAYRATRSEAMEVRKAERELACNGFEAEGAQWDEEHPITVAFRDYLINRREDRRA